MWRRPLVWWPSASEAVVTRCMQYSNSKAREPTEEYICYIPLATQVQLPLRMYVYKAQPCKINLILVCICSLCTAGALLRGTENNVAIKHIVQRHYITWALHWYCMYLITRMVPSSCRKMALPISHFTAKKSAPAIAWLAALKKQVGCFNYRVDWSAFVVTHHRCYEDSCGCKMNWAAAPWVSLCN